ncbi:hypothetical protein AB0H76_31635 [Nocardia sp. NPDC050712]|uniref:hypothetical protein n=1 Tax=Nocardia sp. NPDC050712 TaxID=3155518 RepID=UPI0033C00533
MTSTQHHRAAAHVTRNTAATQSLFAIPGLLVELETTMSRSDARGTQSVGGRTSIKGREPILPYDKVAADARALLLDILGRVVAQMSAVVGQPAPAAPRDRVLFASACLPDLPDDSAVWAGIGDVARAVRVARAAIDRPEVHRVLGRCGCGAPLYAAEIRDVLACESCGRTHSAADVRATALVRAADKLATAAQLARLLPWMGETRITADRIRQWAVRGKLAAHSVDGRTLYRVGDVLALVSGCR